MKLSTLFIHGKTETKMIQTKTIILLHFSVFFVVASEFRHLYCNGGLKSSLWCACHHALHLERLWHNESAKPKRCRDHKQFVFQCFLLAVPKGCGLGSSSALSRRFVGWTWERLKGTEAGQPKEKQQDSVKTD